MRCRKCQEKENIEASALQQAIEEILKRIEIDDFFAANENCTIKILPPTPRPLLIRRAGSRIIVVEDDRSEFIETIREPSGPEIEFEVLDDGTWAIAGLREEYCRRAKRSIVYEDDGCRVVRPIRQRRFQKFAAEWANNLLIRRYVSGTLRYARKW
jgi:hypothetical protein